MLLDRFPSIAALATFVAVCLIVSHEWGYFGIIGAELQSFFTTYDYVSQLIVWIGPAFILLIIVIGIQVALLRSDNFEVKQVATSKWGKRFENWYMEVFQAIVLIIAVLFSDESRRISFYVLAALLWMRLAFYILTYKGFQETSKTMGGVMIGAVPAAMILFYGVGRDEAYSDLMDTRNKYEIKLKGQSVSREVRVARLIEKGVIVFDTRTKSVEFYRHDNVDLVKRAMPMWETRSFLCRALNWRCK